MSLRKGVEKLEYLQTNKSKYIILNQIKNGGSSCIKLVKDENEEVFVAKILSKKSKKDLIRFKNEIEFQSTINSNYIVHIVDNGIYEKKFFYIMKKYDCSLRELINDKSILKSKMIEYVLQICEGIRYYSQNEYKICHRDIKPENILYDKTNDRVLIADFGISKFKNSTITEKSDRLANFDYHAPEQRINNKYKCETGIYTDIYALGLILNEIFTGEIPQGENYKKIKILESDYYFLNDIIDSMIIQNPMLRENDITNIISKIEIGLSENNEYNQDSLEMLSYYDEEISLTKSKIQIIDDSKLIKNIIKYNYSIKNMNFEYHENILYDIDEISFNDIFVLDSLKILFTMFRYESNSKDISSFNADKEENIVYINRFNVFFSNIKISRIIKEKYKMLFKYFYALSEHHLPKVLSEITDKKDQLKAQLYCKPLLYIFLSRYDYFVLYAENEDIKDNFNILDFVCVHEVLQLDSLNDQLISIDNKTKKMVELLKNKFPSIMVIDNTINLEIVFKNINDYESFISNIRNYYIKSTSYVEKGDIDDIIKRISLKSKYRVVDLYEFDLNVIFARIFKQEQ